jgi:hypothetical protein
VQSASYCSQHVVGQSPTWQLYVMLPVQPVKTPGPQQGEDEAQEGYAPQSIVFTPEQPEYVSRQQTAVVPCPPPV